MAPPPDAAPCIGGGSTFELRVSPGEDARLDFTPYMRKSPRASPVRARVPVDAPIAGATYARLFPELPAYSADEQFLFALGRVGGLCDCADPNDTPESLGCTAAGWPVFGQFIGHDITADRSALRPHVDPGQLRNARSPQLNLECLYGDGPVGNPFLYQRIDAAKFLTGPDGKDVQRNTEGIAIIGDPRNDSHLLISQMHLAFVHAHNAFVDRARTAGVPEAKVFETAARELRWHYQSAILDEFLPSLIGQKFTDDLLRDGCRFYRPESAFIPLEFADAAYRYGHAQIRHEYVLNERRESLPIFPDLIGFRPVPRERVVDWSYFFDDVGGTSAQRAKRIDGRMVAPLLALPAAIVGDSQVEEYRSLAVRDLERGQSVGLPSGEAVAHLLGEPPLSRDEIGAVSAGWHDETPLWYYILREADVRCGGNALGPVGARIVGEVLVGLLDRDPTSVRHAPDDWQPTVSLLQLLVRGFV